MRTNYKELSFYDLMQLPKFKKASADNDKDAMEEVLWECGLDTNEPYVIRHCLHRPLSSNTPQETYRVDGVGRIDKEWLADPHSRLVDHIASSGDISLQNELLGMNPRESADIAYDWDEDIEDGDEDLYESEGDC